jgi:hypothetical protein
MDGVPSHDDVVRLWSATVAQTGGEPAIIVLPSPSDAVVLSAFRPVEALTLVETVTMIVESIHERIIRPCRWMAMAVPGYSQDVPTDGPIPVHGDLQKAYADGDENVREALSVLIHTNEPDAPVMMRTYFQPLLEPEDEVGKAADDGPMAYAIRVGLLIANMDEHG